MNETIVAWLLTFMLAVAPTTQKQYHPDAKETQDQTLERYNSIASDVASVVWNPDNAPLFTGPHGRARSAAIVLSIMFHESDFRRDVDFGLGKAGRGDSGRSWCLMQVQIGTGRTPDWNKAKHRFKMWGDKPEDIIKGWSGEELVSDRKKCIIAGYRIMHASFFTCRGLPVSDWLRAYASGNCEDGATQSAARMNFGINWYNKHQPPFTDQDVVDETSRHKGTLAYSP